MVCNLARFSREYRSRPLPEKREGRDESDGERNGDYATVGEMKDFSDFSYFIQKAALVDLDWAKVRMGFGPRSLCAATTLLPGSGTWHHHRVIELPPFGGVFSSAKIL
ncbi:hypothetical protein Taro_007652 [Colocasia esculenta]|uniref:Uncharacterized protein n=1 Tax=Colocasia esculenta TaxID=4460 RepID=A0A843TW03_COLES|nr:hypothetical protein [Colocasia esculenta]